MNLVDRMKKETILAGVQETRYDRITFKLYQKNPILVQKFLEYIYENFYKEIEKIRAYITADMWAMQEVIPGGKDLAEQKLLRAAQEKLVLAWKRDANNPNSFERMYNVEQNNDQAVSNEGSCVRSEDSGTDESRV